MSTGGAAAAVVGKDSCPMSSVISESVAPVVLGLGVDRTEVGQGSPAMAASRLSLIVVWTRNS